FYQHVSILMARHRALDEQEAFGIVDFNDLKILHRALALAHMAGHFLAFEYATRILTLAGRTVRAMRDRHAVRRFQTGEIPALHYALEALTDGLAGNIDILARHEMAGENLGANLEERIFRHAEFCDFGFGLHFALGEMTAQRFGGILRLARADAELNGRI